MDIARAIRDHLKDDSAVAAIVGEKVRLSWAHHDELPFVTIDGPHTIPTNYQKGSGGRVQSMLQIDCWEKSRIKTVALSTAVREALYRRASGTMGDEDLTVRAVTLLDGPTALDQPPTDKSKDGVFRDMLEFSAWHAQSVPTPS